MDEAKLVKKANEVITQLLKYLEVEAEVETAYNQDDSEHPFVDVHIDGDDLGHLIGNRGVTLNAIQSVVGTILMRNFNEVCRIVIDVNGYRQKRKEYLENLAIQAMQQAIDSGQDTELPPMSAYERRIVHMKLVDESGVSTESEGEGSIRHIVIKPQVSE